MATVALRRFTNPDTLKHISNSNLVELLSPYREFFTGRGLQLPAANDGQVDCQKLASIFMTPDTDMPGNLADALFLIHEMSTKEAMDKLQEAAESCQPPVDLTGADEPADVAVRVWLRRRALIEQVNAEYELARPKAFLSFLTDCVTVPAFIEPGEAVQREWEKFMDAWFEKKKRGSGCRIFIYPRDGECWVMVRHGEPYRREGSLVKGEPGSVFYRPQQHDILIYDKVGGELRIHAGTQGERELYRKTFGRFVFKNDDFFPGDGKYTLDPLIQSGEAALNCNKDVDGIESVKLREVEFQCLGSGRGNTEREIRKANDLFAAFATRGFKFKEGQDLRRAVFLVKFKDAKRPRCVTIMPSNRAKYERDDDGTFLEAWLKKQKFILEHHDDENDGTLGES